LVFNFLTNCVLSPPKKKIHSYICSDLRFEVHRAINLSPCHHYHHHGSLGNRCVGCTPLYGDIDFESTHPLGITDTDDIGAKRARKGWEEDGRTRDGSSCDDDLPPGQKRTVLNILERYTHID
jgi:hypothetical protein